MGKKPNFDILYQVLSGRVGDFFIFINPIQDGLSANLFGTGGADSAPP